MTKKEDIQQRRLEDLEGDTLRGMCQAFPMPLIAAGVGRGMAIPYKPGPANVPSGVHKPSRVGR